MELTAEMVKLLAPILAIELLMKLVALRDLAKRTHNQVKFGRRWVWAVAIIAITALGWVIYLAWGREDREA